ncbi:MAG: hypothetical protein ACLFVT_08015 [Syntrophobacteria bacterium]
MARTTRDAPEPGRPTRLPPMPADDTDHMKKATRLAARTLQQDFSIGNSHRTEELT